MLTDEQIGAMIEQLPDAVEFVTPYFAFARAIEKAALESAIQQLLAISARQTALSGSVAAHDCIEAVQKLKKAGGEGK